MVETIQLKFKIDIYLVVIFHNHMKLKTKIWKIGSSSFKSGTNADFILV